MKNKNKIMLIITGIIIIICICIGFTKKEFQNDTFYTIKVGESIVKNGIDGIDHFSWHKLSYTYPHWLYDVGIYEVYHHFKFNGIYVSTIILYTILGLLMFFINLRITKSTFITLVSTIMSVIICGIYATARAQLITYILFLLEVFFIEGLLTSSKKRYMILLFLICILIANIHSAVWPFYFILMLPYMAQEILGIIKEKKNKSSKSKVFENKLIFKRYEGFKLLLVVFFISLLLGFLTPIGLSPYTYAFKIALGNTQDYIMEHKGLILIENPFVLIFLLISLFIMIFTKVKIRVSDFFLILGLVVMSFISVRHVSFLLVIGMISLNRMIVDLFSIKLNGKIFDFEIEWYGGLILVFVVILTSKFIYDNKTNTAFINSEKYPIEAINYLKEEYNIKEIKIFNDYDFGSYLMYRKIPVYIDSRSDLYTKPFNNKFDIFNEYTDISYNYGAVFNKYGITHVLIYSDSELARILTASSNYSTVYSDKAFKLFEVLSNKEG